MNFPTLLIKLVEVAAKSHDEDYRNDKENGKKDYGYDGHCGEAFGFNGEHFKVDQGATDSTGGVTKLKRAVKVYYSPQKLP